jgi:hypothetical protein
MSDRKQENQRTYARRKLRQKIGIPNVPQLPDDICGDGQDLTPEQERTASMVIEAATWAIQAARQHRRPSYDVPEYSVSLRNGCLVGRAVR